MLSPVAQCSFEFQPFIMKIYSLCIPAREREEVEKKVQKIKALLILSFMAFYAHVWRPCYFYMEATPDCQ